MTCAPPPHKQQLIEMRPAYSARDLTKGGDPAHIVMDAQTYTLRITKTGKLILTK